MIPKPGEVYLVDLGMAGKVRPVVIVSREDANAPRALSDGRDRLRCTSLQEGNWPWVFVGRDTTSTALWLIPSSKVASFAPCLWAKSAR